MYCVNCGESNRLGARFCVSCGRRLTQKNKSAGIDGQMHIDDILAEEKKPKRPKAAEGTRVAPQKENPTQPRRVSVFDDDDDGHEFIVSKAKKAYTGGADLTEKPKIKLPERKPVKLLYDDDLLEKPKKPREGVSEQKIKLPERKPAKLLYDDELSEKPKKPRESVSDKKTKLSERRPAPQKHDDDYLVKPRKPRESVSEPKIKLPERKPAPKHHDDDYTVKPRKPRESVSESKTKLTERKPAPKKHDDDYIVKPRKPRESVSEPKVKLPERGTAPKKRDDDFFVKPKKPTSDMRTAYGDDFSEKPRRPRAGVSDTKAKVAPRRPAPVEDDYIRPKKPKAEYAEPKIKLPPRKPVLIYDDLEIEKPKKPNPTKRPTRSNGGSYDKKPKRSGAGGASRRAPIRTGRGGARMSDAKRRAANAKRRAVYSYDDRETFAEKHLRSIIAMCMLAVFICVFLAWGNLTESGLRTFAQFGVGGTQGYILLGDDCMEYGNYPRAVEHYYGALSREASYEAAIKLARAYAKTGDAEREAGALLYCMDKYPKETEARERLMQLYPNPQTRPTRVNEALNAAR